MIAIQTKDLLERLKRGSFEQADVDVLERISMHDLVAELEAEYGHRIQERHLHEKWEIGMARSLRFELASFASKARCFPIVCVSPIYRQCVFLSGEREFATGISIVRSLRIRPVRKPTAGLAMSTGSGFKLDRTSDGWGIKPLASRTVKLSDEFLRKRGWRFDALRSLLPVG